MKPSQSLFFNRLVTNYPFLKDYVDIITPVSMAIGMMCACGIIFKATKKEKNLKYNRNLVKDKDWQDIHM